MPHAQQQKVVNRLARIKGHIEGIQEIIEAR
ncbi:MAG: metal-sensing transcriptional repressor [Leptolyngbya sp. UWPOB_LEPTO1]|nr:metal-sensing transcriptional repressor [Leptolyngbya sp. UWPOB_LEPTO1]MBN8560216.1 metal-sensing transcriptional repressor [Leptolyngbya sp. UWPOB_LEPTO1]